MTLKSSTNSRALAALLVSLALLPATTSRARAAPHRSPASSKTQIAPKTPATPSLATVGLIDGETDGHLSVVTVRFDKEPTAGELPHLAEHGSFLQLDLPNTIVPEPGKFYDGNNPYLTKIAVYQLTPTDAGIRFFVSRDAAKVKQATTAEMLGNRLVLTVDNTRLESLLAEPASPSTLVGPPAPQTPSAEAVIARTAVRHDGPPPSELLKKDSKKSAIVGSGVIDMRGKLIQVTAFTAFMLLLLVGSWSLKPYLRKRRLARGDGEAAPLCMRTLATLPLASRQKVSLIQVGDEKILIGVTPDSVTFLTAIGRSEHQNAAVRPAPQPAAIPAPHAAPAQLPGAFSRMLEARTNTVDMHPAPVLKNLEGNDEASLNEAPRRRPQPIRPPAREKASTRHQIRESDEQPKVAPERRGVAQRINIAVGEDGVRNLRPGRESAPRRQPEAPANERTNEGGHTAVDDVTRLIREKLKTLRTI